MKTTILQIFNNTIRYFKKVSKYYRNSSECNSCWKWLLLEIKKLGLKPVSDNFSDFSKNAKEQYGNIMFDIDSNDNSCENIILQAHYDMVLVGSNLDFVRKNGIQIQQEKTNNGLIIHSKKYQTSLGADDGIGIALILSLAKNSNIFKHGKIRCILTCDEEIPNSGSKSKEIKKWLIYDKLINLDCSHIDKVRIGCFGACETNFLKKINPKKIDSSKNIYELTVSGLIGIHSANVKNFHANAIKLLFEAISSIPDVQIIAYNNLNNTKTNVVPSSGKIIFVSKLNLKEIESILNFESFKKKYPFEKDITFNIQEINSVFEKCIDSKQTKEIINFIFQLPFGLILKKKNKFPRLTANISPLNSFNCNKTDVIELSTFSRADDSILFEKMNSKIKIKAQKSNWKILNQSFDPVWKPVKDSTLQKLFKQAAEKAKNKIQFQTTPAWLEPADFIKVKPNMDIISIGSKLNNCHTVNETLYVNTVKIIIDELLNIFRLLKKI